MAVGTTPETAATTLAEGANASSGGTAVVEHPRGLMKLYFELTKARLSAVVVLTTAVGYALAQPPDTKISWLRFGICVGGTALVVCGANAMNQYMERLRDARMERTKGRPLPKGEMSPSHAFWFAVAISVLGLAALGLWTNWLATVIAAFGFVSYVAWYTPLKTRTSLNTLVGGISGAVPPMIGWAAASGKLELGAWLLFFLQLVWQIPHFLALAWMYREDYERGGFVMMPQQDPTGARTAYFALLYSVMLAPLGAAFVVAGVGQTGNVFLFGSAFLGLVMAFLAWRFFQRRERKEARALFLASLIYLPAVLGLFFV